MRAGSVVYLFFTRLGEGDLMLCRPKMRDAIFKKSLGKVVPALDYTYSMERHRHPPGFGG